MGHWSTPSLWSNGECWVIGGGASWLKEFDVPEEIISKVVKRDAKPSVLSDYLKPIHNKHIIGINNAYQLGDWVDVLFFGDYAWYLVHRMALANFSGLKISCCRKFVSLPNDKCDGVKVLKRDPNHRLGITDDKTKVAWNHNSGSAAISVAAHFGVKRIVLLGFDMKMSAENISHWHGSHAKLGATIKPPPFRKHLEGFPMIAKDAKNLGIEILLIGNESAIDVFKKVSVKELL